MSDPTSYAIAKDIVTLVGGIFTLTIAAIGARAAIGQWRDSTREKRESLRWQQAEMGRQLVDDLLESNDEDEEYYAWDAMKMLDYQDASKPYFSKPIGGERREITHGVIRDALRPTPLNESDPKLLYVRECFDELYFAFARLQDAIDHGLVTFSHVTFPAEYYVDLMAQDAGLHADYLSKYRYQRTLRFLENFCSWKKARLTEGTKGAEGSGGTEGLKISRIPV